MGESKLPAASISPLVYGLFFLSGAAGLLYQVIWVRQFSVFFGSSTHSVVAVITAFLGGLALGSAIFGRLGHRWQPQALLRLYGWLEICTGVSAAATILLLHWIVPLYQNFSDGSTLTPRLLLLKFMLTVPCLLIPTTLMGGSLPVMVGALRRVFSRVDETFSLLYAINTFGAVFGVCVSAFVLIESFGLQATLLIAVAVNCIVGVTAQFLRLPASPSDASAVHPPAPAAASHWSRHDRMVVVALGCTGFIAIALEVLWSRMLIPVTGTAVYAFALILAINLLGIALGSLLYYKLFRDAVAPPWTFPVTQICIAIFSFVATVLYVVTPEHGSAFVVFLIVLPVTVCMGLAFPAALSLLSDRAHQRGAVGWTYALNTVGAIAGGIAANYVLIPTFGSGVSVAIGSVLSAALAATFAFVYRDRITVPRQRKIIHSFTTATVVTLIAIMVFAPTLLLDRTTRQYRHRAASEGGTVRTLEDEVASVVGYADDAARHYELLVDGVGITDLGIETKMMAYMPLALHPAPKRMLAICLGMGSTYRAGILAGVHTDAVELSPSVVDMFPLFYADAGAISESPLSTVIVNDGRNYATLTHQVYDTITIDPPPPFYAAGTTVLYAREFYESLKRRLAPDGIVSQWLYYAGSRRDDIAPALKAFTDSFPYVLAYASLSADAGVHLFGSRVPIALSEAGYRRIFENSAVTADLATVERTITAQTITDMFIADREHLVKLVSNFRPVTDDRPRTEYFLLRRLFHRQPMMTHAVMRLQRWDGS